jgi:hypothetical protein
MTQQWGIPNAGQGERPVFPRRTEHAKILWLAQAQTVAEGRLSLFLCDDCCGPAEYYGVEDHIWKRASEGCELGIRAMLCLRCLSNRLGRGLKMSDFPDPESCRINNWIYCEDLERPPNDLNRFRIPESAEF